MSDHILVVEKADDWHEDEPYFDLAIECATPATCNGWIECREPHEGFDPDDESSPAFDQLEDVLIHGVNHEWKYGHGWAVAYEGCIVAWDHDHVVEYGSDIAHEHGEGRHQVDSDWDDWGLVLQYAASEVSS